MIFCVPLYSEETQLFVYRTRWLSASQLAEIISPLISPAGTVEFLSTTGQVIISDEPRIISQIRNKITMIDVSSDTPQYLEHILGVYARVQATLEVDSEPSLIINRRIRCGETQIDDNFEKVLYRLGRIRSEDRYMVSGDELRLTPDFKTGTLSLNIVYRFQKVAGWDSSGDPILHQNELVKNFKIRSSEEMNFPLISDNGISANLRTKIVLDDFSG